MMNKKPKNVALLFVGHSHFLPILYQRERPEGIVLDDLLEEQPFKGIATEVVYIPLVSKKGGTGPEIGFAQVLCNAFRSLVETVDEPENLHVQVVLSIGGNTHNWIGLVHNKYTFDLVIPDEEVEVNHQIPLVSYSAILQILQRKSERNFSAMRMIKETLLAFSGKATVSFFHMEFPPPVGDDAVVIENLDSTYLRNFPVIERIASPSLRYKLWKTYCLVYAEYCAQIGVQIIKVPKDILLDGRYLLPEHYGHNATHANWKFYKTMIDELLALRDR